jgi:hypothetical protein
MSLNDELYCDGCFLYIGQQKHGVFKKPGKNGECAEHYLHYHNRGPDDCYQRIRKTSLRSAESRQAA